VPGQRCQCHLIQNAMAHVPKIAMRTEVAARVSPRFSRKRRRSCDSLLPSSRDDLGNRTCLPEHGSQMTHL
jgi:hypothetical protein